MNKHCFQCLLVLLFTLSFHAQETPPESLKTGLVLSGGGAKGLAHIGALKIIEEAGVELDYIGGTSMGAIIGALYASGYSAHQLDSIFRRTDLNQLIQDELPRSAKTFYEKEDSERYAITLPFNNLSLTFPSAISKGQNVYHLFVKLLHHVNHIENFSELPIPFFCIATDIEKGEAVVLEKGYLPEAIAASGAFPSLFEPVEVGNRVLIDGGVVNNYPINEIKKRGVQKVIGVDVQDTLVSREALKSATGILLQINNYRTVNDMKTKTPVTDIYIRPEIQEFTVISFDEGAKIVASGEAAARLKLPELLELARKQNRRVKKQLLKPIKDSVKLKSLTIEGNEHYTRGYIRGKLRYRLNKTLSFDKLQQGISNIAATNNFKSIRYQLKPNGSDEDLLLKIREGENKTLLRIGVHYDDLYKTAALVNLTQKDILFNDDVASFDFILGDNVRYNFEYYIDKGFYWSIGFKSRYNSFKEEVDFDLIKDDLNLLPAALSEVNLSISDFTNQLYAQTVFREEFALGAGIEHKKLRYRTLTFFDAAQTTTVFENSTYLGPFGFLKLDTYDKKYYPSRGVFFDGRFNLYLYSSDFSNRFSEFSVARGTLGAAFPITSFLSTQITTEAGFKLGNTELGIFDFVLGGYGNNFINNFIALPGYDFLSLRGDSFIKGSIRLDAEFAKKNHLLAGAHYANVGNEIYEDGEWFSLPDFSGYSLGYGLETFIGPVEVNYSYSPETSESELFFSIGFWF